MLSVLVHWISRMRSSKRGNLSAYPSSGWFSAFDEAALREPPIQRMIICDLLPNMEATEVCEVVTDYRFLKFFCFIFTVSALLFFCSFCIKVIFNRLRRFFSWLWSIRVFRVKTEYQMPPVLSEGSPLDVERWLCQLDL